MSNDEIIQHYDYLIRLAASICNSQNDAEDLVSDTMLAAVAFLYHGGTIEYPKTWLTNTLYHKHNDSLRKKYRTPFTVCLDEGMEIPEEDDTEFLTSDEAARVRKEINHLSYITRETMIRFYFGNQSIADIADELEIPIGTVKSRLYTGRNQIKKGLEAMETLENYLPGQLYLSFGGSEGINGKPRSLIEGDLIAQNLLILAYQKPLTLSELSKSIGIPTAYIEPIVRKLVDGELMVQMESGKVYTDFIITKPQDTLAVFHPQIEFTNRHFNIIWDIIEKMSSKIAEMDFVKEMGDEERTKLDRYAVLKALQDFQHFGTMKIEPPRFPKRKDGGWWYANAVAFEAGYSMKEYRKASEYAIHGGHRTTDAISVGRTKRIWFYEFDTTLWDSPHRYGGAYSLYFKYIIPLLWSIYDGNKLESLDIPNEFISYTSTLERLGVIGHENGKLCLKIPVLKKKNYDRMCEIIKSATEELNISIGK